MKTVQINPIIVLVLILTGLAIFYRNQIKETFNNVCQVQKYVTVNNAEYRGLNLLGVNSLDTHIASISSKQCQDLCSSYTECDGYSFYEPGNRCYLFSKGGFVYDRKGFESGMKM